MKNKVLVTGNSVDAKFLAPLTTAGFRVHNPTHILSEQELSIELEDAVAYLLGGDERATESAVKNARDLKVVAFLGVGYESFMDASGISRLGIRITNTPGTLTNSVSEFTVGQLLNLRRRLTQYTNAYMSGKQGTETKQHDLASTRIGIIGLGAIGTRIAETLRQGFGSDIRYFSRTRKPGVEDRLSISYLSLPDLLSWAEAYIVMTPGNDATRGLIGARELAHIPASAGRLLVNTARAFVVDPAALLSALEDGRLAATAFDGFYDDESDRAKLLALGQERLLVTGHIASLTSDARDGMARKAVQSILNVLSKGDDENVVNRDSLPNGA